jgi:hypothetical protein
MLFGQGEERFQCQQTLLGALFALLEELERQVRELSLQRGHLVFHLHKPRSQIGAEKGSGRCPTFSLVWPGAGIKSCHRKCKNLIMKAGQNVDLFAGQALDSRICRMGMQRHLGLHQPTFAAFWDRWQASDNTRSAKDWS